MSKDKKTPKLRSYLVHGKWPSTKWDFNHHIIPPRSGNVAYRMDTISRGAASFSEYAQEGYLSKPPKYVYDRFDDPVRGMLEETLAEAEGGGVCVTFSTGMAAIAALLGITLTSGQEVISHYTIYGGTYGLFNKWYKRYNIKVNYVDMSEPENILAATNENTRVVYFETPVNPNLDILDIARIKEVVDQANKDRSEDRKITTMIDNTFASPFCQRPYKMGIDMVVESLTKHISGFGIDTGGMTIVDDKWQMDLFNYRKDFGASLSPKAAWEILTHGLPTLPLRLKTTQESALKVARFLESHKHVKTVSYPGLESHPQHELARKQMRDFDGNFAPGALLYFEMNFKNPDEDIVKMMEFISKEIYSLTFAVSLGMIKTLIEAPGPMTHSSFSDEDLEAGGTSMHGIRMAIGIEDPDDIISDLEAVFDHVM